MQDGTEVTLRPLNLKGLRKFMAKIEEMKETKDEEEIIDILVDAAAICLMKDHPEYWDKRKDRGENKTDGGFSEAAEEALDMPTVYRILDICGGVKLDDPNLVAAAMAANQENPGQA